MDVLFRLANISMYQHDWSNAMHYYSTLLNFKPAHQKAHHNLAVLHLLQAKKHLNYYIANNYQRLDHKELGELFVAINGYTKPTSMTIDELDQIADQIKSH